MTNIHQDYYDRWADYLEKRFPFRLRNNKWLYIIQALLIFGAFIVALIIALKTVKMKRTYKEVAGLDVSVCTLIFTIIFAYGFGFVAVVNDWWFFFPDLFSGIFWNLGKGHMVLGDVIFYPLSAIMGHIAVIFTLMLSEAPKPSRKDDILKALFFVPAFVVITFGITFGSEVMVGNTLWLYLPFCLIGIITFHRFSAFQLWFPTGVFVVCEFGWDVLARTLGVWIFPDNVTNPGMYFPEVVLFHVGKYPIIWQPEMLQMSYVSGLISLSFFFVARTFMRGERITGTTN